MQLYIMFYETRSLLPITKHVHLLSVCTWPQDLASLARSESEPEKMRTMDLLLCQELSMLHDS